MSANEGSNWYVVHTHAHAEGKAARHLARQGFASYLPRYQKRRRHARKVEIVAAPLFPRYLFVMIDIAVQRWLSIGGTVGVTRLVCNGDMPAQVPEAIIRGLRAQEDADGFVRLSRRPVFRPGDQIRVVDGVFSSCLGLFEGMPDGERVAILLELLGRKVRVLLDGDAVAAA